MNDQPASQPVPVDNAPVPTGRSSRQGPVLRRSDQLQTSTTDQRLLQSRGDASWVHSDQWRVLRIQSEFVEGFGTLADLGPAISIFGSARTRPDHPMYQAAGQLAAGLVDLGYAVITGGGPGIMEAANKGAAEAGGVSVGLGIELPYESSLNEHVNLGINFRYFFARKVMFLKYAEGFIVMPGGLGTFDELFEAMTLAQTGKIRHFPVVLFGSEYWSGMVDWLRERVLSEGYINEGDLDAFIVTDDMDEALAHVTAGPSRHRPID
ncbi:TIGR00730 family Rossman fold protein [Propionibacteriaceae bacterium G1746]|uniref:LOG family protein n=1 Tax=Aestuariimicrobium sp. G57 TaxID=3418485 RepID=UPI003C283A36